MMVSDGSQSKARLPRHALPSGRCMPCGTSLHSGSTVPSPCHCGTHCADTRFSPFLVMISWIVVHTSWKWGNVTGVGTDTLECPLSRVRVQQSPRYGKARNNDLVTGATKVTHVPIPDVFPAIHARFQCDRKSGFVIKSVYCRSCKQ